ncbi:hypothetical protein GCM10027059_24140 [Myceligenerans halotolerans]
MRSIDWDEFRDRIAKAHTALRLERQPSYAMAYEEESINAFLAGDPQDPTTVPEFAEYFRRVADRTAAGNRIERVRVHQDPPTDYQRWVRWLGRWNEEAGEVMRYTTPERAAAAGLDAAGPDDWWLLDDAVLLRMVYAEPGVATLYLVDDEAEIAKAKEWWQLALRAAS